MLLKDMRQRYILGFMSLKNLYRVARCLYVAREVSTQDYYYTVDFCLRRGLTEADMDYYRYLEIVTKLKHGELDPCYLSFARSWKRANSSVRQYLGRKLEQMYLERNYSAIRAMSRNDAQCRKVSDRITGGNLRAEWTRERWASAGPSTRVEISHRAKWDKVGADI